MSDGTVFVMAQGWLLFTLASAALAVVFTACLEMLSQWVYSDEPCEENNTAAAAAAAAAAPVGNEAGIADNNNHNQELEDLRQQVRQCCRYNSRVGKAMRSMTPTEYGSVRAWHMSPGT